MARHGVSFSSFVADMSAVALMLTMLNPLVSSLMAASRLAATRIPVMYQAGLKGLDRVSTIWSTVAGIGELTVYRNENATLFDSVLGLGLLFAGGLGIHRNRDLFRNDDSRYFVLNRNWAATASFGSSSFPRDCLAETLHGSRKMYSLSSKILNAVASKSNIKSKRTEVSRIKRELILEAAYELAIDPNVAYITRKRLAAKCGYPDRYLSTQFSMKQIREIFIGELSDDELMKFDRSAITFLRIKQGILYLQNGVLTVTKVAAHTGIHASKIIFFLRRYPQYKSVVNESSFSADSSLTDEMRKVAIDVLLSKGDSGMKYYDPGVNAVFQKQHLSKLLESVDGNLATVFKSHRDILYRQINSLSAGGFISRDMKIEFLDRLNTRKIKATNDMNLDESQLAAQLISSMLVLRHNLQFPYRLLDKQQQITFDKYVPYLICDVDSYKLISHQSTLKSLVIAELKFGKLSSEEKQQIAEIFGDFNKFGTIG